MAPSITWLHLSDLHACDPRTGWDAGEVLADLEKDLDRLREAHELAPDLIFFTGDAGFGHLGTGDGESLAEQLDQAEGFFRRVRGRLGDRHRHAQGILCRPRHRRLARRCR